MSELIALLNEREVGTVRQERGRIAFEYADSWRSAPDAYPLSLSMPLAARKHGHASIAPFLWGLLPDNEFILTQWARRFQVSAHNPFALIGNVGEDCAGAIQFVRPERLDAFLHAAPGTVEWLTEADVADRLRALRMDASAWRSPRDTGQFSLAGAQPKTALVFDGQRWGVPSGREPTTHILKPATIGLDGHAQNEHLCLSLARALGIPAARSEVLAFEDVTAIVVNRYDRIRRAEPRGETLTYRVHQEDFCQALRVHPSLKYQNQGGPGPKSIVDLLRANVYSVTALWTARAPWTFAFNLTRQPAISVPMWPRADGLPNSVQIAAAQFPRRSGAASRARDRVGTAGCGVSFRLGRASAPRRSNCWVRRPLCIPVLARKGRAIPRQCE